jgi:heme oxygenase (biliverdin-IX-beta and delta-forming)
MALALLYQGTRMQLRASGCDDTISGFLGGHPRGWRSFVPPDTLVPVVEASGTRTDLPARLRADTRDVHERLERRLGLPGASAAAYRATLEAFRGFYAPVEERLRKTPWEALGLDFVAKTAWLDQDLRALGADDTAIDALPRCSRLPGVERLDRALGCRYVLEGATLGGQIVLRGLQGIPLRAARFFRGYGEETGPRWRRFQSALERADALAGFVPGQTVAAARETFLCFEEWLQSRGILR